MQLRDLLFFGQVKIINFLKHNKIEEYIIFITPFHIKLLAEAKQAFVDATFKSTSKIILPIIKYSDFPKRK